LAGVGATVREVVMRIEMVVVVDYKPSSVEIIIDGTIEPSCGRPSRRAPLLFFVPPLLVREMFVCF
jgi:hypothetical protein